MGTSISSALRVSSTRRPRLRTPNGLIDLSWHSERAVAACPGASSLPSDCRQLRECGCSSILPDQSPIVPILSRKARTKERTAKLCRNIGTGAYQTALLRYVLVGEAGVMDWQLTCCIIRYNSSRACAEQPTDLQP